MESKPRSKRHCWECRRRCLVCDFTEPACRRCSTSGIECPGYGDVKPVKFKWLPPGKVVSRGRGRKKSSSKEAASETTKSTKTITKLSSKAVLNDNIPISLFNIGTETYDIAECIEYFNSCIYQGLLPLCELGDNPHIYPLSAKHVRRASWAPDYLRLGMICMILGHQINRMRGNPESRRLTEKFYSYWGLSIRSLRDHLDKEDRRHGDTVIGGILTLLLVDVQLGTSLNWRCHLEGLYGLIMQRGGFEATTRSRVLKPLLRCLWVLAVMGNTTCPASDLLTIGSEPETANFLLKQFRKEMSPYHMCPLPLFSDIIRVNHLRMCATQYTNTTTEELSQEANTILQRVQDFSPEQWADSRRSPEDWVLIGRIHQAAVVIYLILSLQSVSILPVTCELSAYCATQGKLLQVLISNGLSSPKTERFMVWPLIVLGVYAVHGDLAMRAFVIKQLPDLSRNLGTSVPLTAKQVLESFWDSGESRWDACFSKPYIFTMQIAVDTGELPPSPMAIH
ncbi:fungal-specific transcription factor domain-containing protein [Daldinia caldariorum]|uniref:fungal-specific transcription factor domain-containing protein n=1 Tax=Daldinia caldariorum TaxID=326644 RepID=UPI0020088CBF|nr:fungal-specific transcription factor domain-containing protein [Daldinia caldariorum]KAI1469851.1 fungal-specific transcription factor domain-containing protein [Daldinia caldariorum]